MMKFEIQQKIILNTFSLIGRFFLNPSINLSILGNLFFFIPSNLNYLKIIGINLDMEISIKIFDLNIIKSGSCVISGNKILNICKNMPKNNLINIEIENKKLKISSNKTKFVLNSFNIESSPKLYKYFLKENNEFLKFKINLNQDILYKLLKNTYFTMPYKEDLNSVFNGMFFEINQKKLTSVTMDGHRLSICSIPMNISTALFNTLLTPRTVHELLRIFNLNRNNNIVNLSVVDNYLKVKLDNMYIITKLMSTDIFPNYKILLKNENKSTKVLIINTKILKESCLRIAALNNERFRKITFFLDKNNLKIISKNNEYEEATENLRVKYEQENLKISFNVEYLIDVLNAITTEEAKIIFTDEFSCFKIQSFPCNNCLYIIMPMNT